MLKNIKTQINIIARQRGVFYCFFLLLGCVIFNYIHNLKRCSSLERYMVPNYLNMSVFSYDNQYGIYILTFMAILLVLPGGLSLAKDRKNRTDILYVNRCGGYKNYYISKIAAVFTVTFVCFTVPFLIEIILNVCAFPNEASEEMRSVYQAYDKRNNVDGTGGTFWMCGIYYLYPGLYAVLRIVLTGLQAGLLSLVPLAVSCFYCKYQAYLLLPVYLMSVFWNNTTFKVFGHKIEHNYASYLTWGNTKLDTSDCIYFLIMVFTVALVSVICMLICEGRRENKR